MFDKVLIVDKDLIEALELTNSLEELGYEVLDVVESGKLAMQYILDIRPDFVVLNIDQNDISMIESAVNMIKSSIPIVYCVK
ncbi:MAG: hypothetical protein HUK28_02470 [Methanobrevibacter sp.]|nr:hypothetical protein [Methanobrevibacter sp.]